jgi:hypothetical protein
VCVCVCTGFDGCVTHLHTFFFGEGVCVCVVVVVVASIHPPSLDRTRIPTKDGVGGVGGGDGDLSIFLSIGL